MLRKVLLAIGGILLAAALVVVVARGPGVAAGHLAFWGFVLLAALVFERGRYKPAAPGHPGPDWIATDERFVDPESGKEVTVFYHPSSGERRYIGR
jgi:hypothetical protein